LNNFKTAQVWLAIYNIVAGPESRAKALSSSARCNTVLRLRPLLTDILMDQLPLLRDLRRMLDELMLGCMGPARQDPAGSCLILEQVSDHSKQHCCSLLSSWGAGWPILDVLHPISIVHLRSEGQSVQMEALEDSQQGSG
jgi:hypothetical protein